MNNDIRWITFNGGVDFGYLLKLLSGSNLPEDEISFSDQMKLYFCNYYDIKEMKREIEFLNGGLSKVANEMDIDRIGISHQAGSDSFVTS